MTAKDVKRMKERARSWKNDRAREELSGGRKRRGEKSEEGLKSGGAGSVIES